MEYVKLTEYNEWEGETWHFWIPIEGNRDSIISLAQYIKGYEDNFELHNGATPEEEVDILVKHEGGSYMAEHTKLEGLLDWEELKESHPSEALYKGGIIDCMVTEGLRFKTIKGGYPE